MSVYEKARELAGAILASDESLRLADLRALAERGGVLDSELRKAAEDYNQLINEALDIVRLSVGAEDNYGSCGRSCGKNDRGI